MESVYTLQQRNTTAQGHTLQAGSGRPVTPLDAARANDIFDHFLNAATLKSILGHYRLICDLLHLRPSTLPNFYPKLKQHLTSWRAKAVWKKFDGRANNKVYGKGRVCPETRVLVIGAGPCGLRTAIEAQMLGAKVVVVEKRDRMSRNNVLHLWPFVIDDLRSLGAKKFFGKFCAGSIDHISIRQLQCILLKVALLLGIEIHTEVSYECLVEPSAEYKRGWRAAVKPVDHPVSQYEFDVIIGADGKRNTLQGFKRKEFRGKLAIAITANFINRRTEAEARVEEISGVAFIFNQKFFKDLYAETQIDLENIVYYKDDTHYFVMTAKKHSLLSKSVIRSDQSDTARLLAPDNVDRAALMAYAREAAEFSTGRQMLDIEFAVNHYGQPDVAMFDFTSMYAAENASRIVEREGYRLLCVLVGDSLLEPFWPTGSGCARGFLSSLDAAWAIRAWGSASPPLAVLAERESIYRLLGGTTPENLHRDSKSYSLDPSSRYPKLNRQVLSSHQVIGLYDTDDVEALKAQTQKEEVQQLQQGVGVIREAAKKRRKVDEDDLLSWIKKQIVDYNLQINDLSESAFKDGKILCAILHHYRPDLVDYKDLPEDNVLCCHIAIELLEKEIGIASILLPNEMATMECSRQQLISYLSQIYETFKREIAHINHPKMIFPLEKIPHVTSLKFAPKKSPFTILKCPSPKKCIRKDLITHRHDRNNRETPFETPIKKQEKKIKKKTFQSNFHKSSTILEQLNMDFIKHNLKPEKHSKCVAKIAKNDENFKNKLLFHCPNVQIQNEARIATNSNSVKVYSASDYLLIVPKVTVSSLVKYFSDTTANANSTKLHNTATLPNANNSSMQNIKDNELKRGEAHCNILFDQQNDKNFSNIQDIVKKKCCFKIQIKHNTSFGHPLNQNLTSNDKCQSQHVNIKLPALSGTENQVSCHTIINNNNVTLSIDNDNVSRTTNIDIEQQSHRPVNQLHSNGEKSVQKLKQRPNCLDRSSPRHKRNTWILSKVLKYGAGKHNMHNVTTAKLNNNHTNNNNNKERRRYYTASARSSTVSDRIRTWLHTNDFDGGSLVATSTIVNYSSTGNIAMNAKGGATSAATSAMLLHPRFTKRIQVDDEMKHVDELIGQQMADNCTDITGLTSVTKSPPLWGNTASYGGGRIVVDRGDRRGDAVIRFGPNGEPISKITGSEKQRQHSKHVSGNQSNVTTTSNHSNGSITRRNNNNNNNKMLSATPPPKLFRSPIRTEDTTNSTKIPIASPLIKSPPNNNKFRGKCPEAVTPLVVKGAKEGDKDQIKVLENTNEGLDVDSNNSMEELTRLMDRFRGVGNGLMSNSSPGDSGGGGGKVRVIQTVSNPFSAITERDDDDEPTTTEMPEMKQHTLNALTGGATTAAESPMHHRNFAGVRAVPNNHHHGHGHGHHHIRQVIPLAAVVGTGNNAIVSSAISGGGGGGGTATSTVAGSASVTGAGAGTGTASTAGAGRSRKRKSSTATGGGGAGGATGGAGGAPTGLGLVWWTFMWVVLEAGVAGFTLFALDLYANGDKYGVATSNVPNNWWFG